MKRLLLITLIFSGCSNQQAIPLVAEDISPILIGETLPNGNFQNVEGEYIQLKAILEEKPTILVFYRGGWCPYCNVQLSGLVEIEEDILELGYQIVAISPDDYKNLQSTIENIVLNTNYFLTLTVNSFKKLALLLEHLLR